jgi:hypothetical protein
MASVSELLQAAEAQKSPGISAMEGLARGYAVGQQQQLDRAKMLILMEQNRREQEQKMRAQQQMQQMISTDQENQRQRDAASVSGQPEPVFSQAKLEWSMGKDGDYTISKAKDTPNYGTDIYGQDASENPVIIGRSNARNRPAYFKGPGGGRGDSSVIEKERRAVEAWTTALRNGMTIVPGGKGMPDKTQPITNKEDALAVGVGLGLDQNKYPEVQKLLKNYQDTGEQKTPMQAIWDWTKGTVQGVMRSGKSSATPRYQRNKKTGDRRVSYDDGKTWQPAQ